MNTTHDETLLALWLEDELHGEEFAAVDAWACANPEHLSAREELRRWKRMMHQALPVEEPPFPDFFNSRIQQSIRELAPAAPAAVKPSWWRTWIFPATAFAGMALAFWVGHRTQQPQPALTTVPPAAADSWTPAVYTPDRSVNAEWFTSDQASATVIVLQGVNAIPDTLDFMETATLPTHNQKATVENGGKEGPK